MVLLIDKNGLYRELRMGDAFWNELKNDTGEPVKSESTTEETMLFKDPQGIFWEVIMDAGFWRMIELHRAGKTSDEARRKALAHIERQQEDARYLKTLQDSRKLRHLRALRKWSHNPKHDDSRLDMVDLSYERELFFRKRHIDIAVREKLAVDEYQARRVCKGFQLFDDEEYIYDLNNDNLEEHDQLFRKRFRPKLKWF